MLVPRASSSPNRGFWAPEGGALLAELCRWAALLTPLSLARHTCASVVAACRPVQVRRWHAGCCLLTPPDAGLWPDGHVCDQHCLWLQHWRVLVDLPVGVERWPAGGNTDSTSWGHRFSKLSDAVAQLCSLSGWKMGCCCAVARRGEAPECRLAYRRRLAASLLILLLLLWLLQGIGAPACAMLLTRWFAASERGTFWGLWNVSTNLGGFLSPIVVGKSNLPYFRSGSSNTPL